MSNSDVWHFDIIYAVAADAHFRAGQLVTAKPAGAFFAPEEVGPNMAKATGLTIDYGTALAISSDFSKWVVDNLQTPTTVVPAP
jgi:hypothetical protein